MWPFGKDKKALASAAAAAALAATPAQAAPVLSIMENTDASASQTTQEAQRPEPKPERKKRATRQTERNDAVFRSKRARELWCAQTEMVLAEEARRTGADRISAKFRRKVQLLVDRKRHPEVFES